MHLWASVRGNTSQSDQIARGFLLTAPGAVLSKLSRALRVHAQAGWGEGSHARAAAALQRNKISHAHTREKHRPNTRNSTLCTHSSLCRRAPEGGAICTASASRNRVLSCLHATLYTLLWSNPHARAFLHLRASVRSNTSQSDQAVRGFLRTAPGAVFSELSRALRVHAQAGWGEGSHVVAPALADLALLGKSACHSEQPRHDGTKSH